MVDNRRLGEILLEQGIIKEDEIENALRYQKEYGGRIGSILVNMGHISADLLLDQLAFQLGYDLLKDHPGLENGQIDDGEAGSAEIFLSRRVETYLQGKGWVFLGYRQQQADFATINPLEYDVIQFLSLTRVSYKLWLATEIEFRELLSARELEWAENRNGEGINVEVLNGEEIDRLRELASEAPVVNLVNSLIAKAVRIGASDLHIEPFNKMYRTRYRVDGIIHESDYLPQHMILPVASRVKILAELDIAEKRRPQDGQINMKTGGKEIDIRVSSIPLVEGESLVMRFLIKDSISYELEELGIETEYVQMLNRDIGETSGMIIVSGPTGSGKTTTLYSCLNKINTNERKIITIEDPVEYQLDGINQIQIQSEIGYDFLHALRSILRHDPDIIMVGEIRDGETARVAMQSSLTGHLVFSTLHTNDAATGFTRLIDLGVEEFLVNSSVKAIIAQRLVRRICPDCGRDIPVEELGEGLGRQIYKVAEKWNQGLVTVKQVVGCDKCGKTGFRGRVAIIEYLRCTDEIKSMDKHRDFSEEIRRYMQENKIRNIFEDGLLKVAKGVTSIEEVYRVCGYGSVPL